MAPAPKPPGQRRRRNVGQAQWQQLPAEGRCGPVPVLPGDPDGWLDSTRAWWETVWCSPMATAWVEADIDSLVRLARMRDEFTRGDLPVSAFSSLQALEDRFGLSPKARRALQWEIARSDGEVVPIAKPAGRRLRAVEAG